MEKLSLLLTLMPGQQPVEKEHLPDALIRLTNNSAETMLVNGRMLLAPEEYPSRINELALLVDGPPESFNMKVFHVNAGEAQPENFTLLQPGEYIEKRYALKDYFYYDQPGRYTIKASYHNEVTYEIPGISSWRGNLVSNEAHFEISN